MELEQCGLIFRAASSTKKTFYSQEAPAWEENGIDPMGDLVKEKPDEDIIFSNVVPLGKENNYVLLQLHGQSSAFQLILERGKKNDGYTSISLYKRNIVKHVSHLYNRLGWRLAYLSPDYYSIYFDKVRAFSFRVRK